MEILRNQNSVFFYGQLIQQFIIRVPKEIFIKNRIFTELLRMNPHERNRIALS